MTNLKKHIEQIAQEVTEQYATGGGRVTLEQVYAVKNGEDKCESHPVIQAIRMELRKRKLI